MSYNSFRYDTKFSLNEYYTSDRETNDMQNQQSNPYQYVFLLSHDVLSLLLENTQGPSLSISFKLIRRKNIFTFRRIISIFTSIVWSPYLDKVNTIWNEICFYRISIEKW
jgi:hypothetical protein